MLGILPSETTLGMASLLPNGDIRVDDTLDIYVDGMHCGNSMAERQKILQAKKADIRSADAKDCLIQERFTFKSGRYSRGQEYFFVIADRDDERRALHRYKFEIDISDMDF